MPDHDPAPAPTAASGSSATSASRRELGARESWLAREGLLRVLLAPPLITAAVGAVLYSIGFAYNVGYFSIIGISGLITGFEPMDHITQGGLTLSGFILLGTIFFLLGSVWKKSRPYAWNMAVMAVLLAMFVVGFRLLPAAFMLFTVGDYLAPFLGVVLPTALYFSFLFVILRATLKRRPIQGPFRKHLRDVSKSQVAAYAISAFTVFLLIAAQQGMGSGIEQISYASGPIAMLTMKDSSHALNGTPCFFLHLREGTIYLFQLDSGGAYLIHVVPMSEVETLTITYA